MASLIKSIREAYHRRKARKCLEKWKMHHSHVGDLSISHKFEMADIYADLYWYAPINGVKREIMYQRHTFKGMKEHIEHDERELLPKRVASFK